MIIAIEGHDGVGKTTLAKFLAAKLGYNYVKHQMKDILGIDDAKCFEMLKKVIDYGDEKITAWFLSFNDICALRMNQSAVLDRHSLLNYYWNGNEGTEEIFRVSQEIFGRPDLTILLTASREVRAERIRKRDGNDADLHNEEILGAKNDKLVEYMKNYGLRFVIIDTSGLDEAEVADFALYEVCGKTAQF